VSANFRVRVPDLSAPPPAGGTGTAPFEASLLPSIGIDAGSDRRSWGEGITVAVVDSGISPHPAFREGQVTHLDLTSERGAFHAHGTAIASLIAGGYPGAEGIAPGAKLLDLRIAGQTGLSDSFLLAEGIRKATERGAEVINISMATYGDAAPVAAAVAEAIRRGITVVAAVGNDGAGMKAWPAAYANVVSVSGIAADGSLAYFSNTGGRPRQRSRGRVPVPRIRCPFRTRPPRPPRLGEEGRNRSRRPLCAADPGNTGHEPVKGNPAGFRCPLRYSSSKPAPSEADGLCRSNIGGPS
jgi:hypothetical protein